MPDANAFGTLILNPAGLDYIKVKSVTTPAPGTPGTSLSVQQILNEVFDSTTGALKVCRPA